VPGSRPPAMDYPAPDWIPTTTWSTALRLGPQTQTQASRRFRMEREQIRAYFEVGILI
jgi:hypothetical protein